MSTTSIRLSVEEAAITSKRHRVTLWKALASGQLHGSQRTPKGRWVIRQECLDAWLDGQKCEHQTQTKKSA